MRKIPAEAFCAAKFFECQPTRGKADVGGVHSTERMCREKELDGHANMLHIYNLLRKFLMLLIL